jgi:FixJ family two-component response regulator
MMPNMTGMDLHAELSQRMPEVVERMVFVTGDPYTPAARKFLDSVSNQWLEKPCPPQRLQGVVRGFLE